MHEPGDPNDDGLVASGVQRAAEDDAAVERAEVEFAAMRWASYLGGASGDVEVSTSDRAQLVGQVHEVGEAWCLVESTGGQHWLVMTDQVTAVICAEFCAHPLPVVRRGAGSVLRRWARTRRTICCFLVNGQSLQGTITEVLADAVVLAPGSGRSRRIIIPLTALVRVLGEPLID